MNRIELLAWIGNRIGKPPGWERVVRRLAPPRRCAPLGELCMPRDGTAFIAPASVPIGWHVALFGGYEPELRKIFKTVLRPGAVAIDIGANIGWHTLLMARLVEPHGRVFAVEANPSVLERLRININANGFRHVEIVACALADKPGTLAFFGPGADDPDAGNGYAVRDPTGSAETITVEARRLDDVVAGAGLDRVDLLKIDVEGFEWPIFIGAEETVGRFRPHIVFEFDANYVSRGGGSATLVDGFFRRHGYRLYAIQRDWTRSISAGDWPECANIWAIPDAVR